MKFWTFLPSLDKEHYMIICANREQYEVQGNVVYKEMQIENILTLVWLIEM